VFPVLREREKGDLTTEGMESTETEGKQVESAGRHSCFKNSLCVLCVLCGEKEKRELTTENAESTEEREELRVTAAILS